MITAHEGDAAAYTWRLSNLALGEQACSLEPPFWNLTNEHLTLSHTGFLLVSQFRMSLVEELILGNKPQSGKAVRTVAAGHGQQVLRPRKAKGKGGPGLAASADAPVTAVAISSCGNFGLVGNAAGRVGPL